MAKGKASKHRHHKRHKPRPPEAAAPPKESAEVVEALELVERIESTYEDDVDERSKEKGEEFFNSVMEKARSIGETIEKTQRVSSAQTTALENILTGVRKWVHEDRD